MVDPGLKIIAVTDVPMETAATQPANISIGVFALTIFMPFRDLGEFELLEGMPPSSIAISSAIMLSRFAFMLQCF
jgi:hypothetical protein